MEGTVQRVEIASLERLQAVLDALEPTQAVAYGIAEQARARVVTKVALRSSPGAVARDRKHFAFPAGPGILMIDHDPQPGSTPVTPEELRAALIQACPPLAAARMLWRPSASSYLVDELTGEEVHGLRGQRLYVIVANAADIPRAGAALYERLWASGVGWFAVSRAGTLLDRNLIDKAVYAPEHLDFAAGAVCEPPLVRGRVEGRILEEALVSIEPFDTRLIRDLTADEQERAAANRNRARAAVQEEREQIRATYIAERSEQLTRERPIDPARAREVVIAAVDRRLLFADFVLTAENGESVAVGKVLDNPNRWHGTRFADPLEPEYGNDLRIAWANLRSGGRPYLFSHAHGGQRFELIRQPATLRVEPGETPRIADEVLNIMRERGDTFDFGSSTMVRVSDGQVVPVTLGWLIDFAGRVIRFERFDGRSSEWRPIDAPERVARAVLERSGERGLPKLSAVITAPTMRANGTVLDVPGFDQKTGLLYLVDEPEAPSVPTTPTPEDAISALHTLWAPFEGFPFVDAAARGAMLAALLSACIRRAIPTCPAFAFDAPAAGSGKTLLARCVAALAGGNASSFTPPDQDDELRKLLFAELRTGAEAVIVDNLPGALGGHVVDQFLTEPLFAGRVLGKSEAEHVPNRTMLMVTANNIAIRADTVRRVLVVRIDAQVEAPYSRAFAFDPVEKVRAQRIELVTAALTILGAYVNAGSPRSVDGLLGSFENWDRLVRGAVCWLAGLQSEIELGDPVATIAASAAVDEGRTVLGRLLAAWHAQFGDRAVRAADVLDARYASDESTEGATLAEALEGVEALSDGVLSAKRFGKYLTKHRDQIVGGLRLTGAPDRKEVMLWRVAGFGRVLPGFYQP
ncbi:MAG: ATP-binding protein [Burkholderiales bacterium]|nr:ATP-binding protein [Burkholderiales bacterium]